MVEISILLPALTHPTRTPAVVSSICQLTFGLPSDQFELFALVPIGETERIVEEVAVRLKPSSLSLQAVEDLLVQRDQLSEQLQRTREALQAISEQMNKLKQCSSEIDREKYNKRGQKLKQLDEDNKKLRGLLKTQSEDSEHLREETRHTVETLRQEFGRMVKELMRKEALRTSADIKGRTQESNRDLQSVRTNKT